MDEPATHPLRFSHLLLRSRLLAADRVNRTLFIVFALIAAFYCWTAGTSWPLDAPVADPYNKLATAFLHFHLYVGHARSVAHVGDLVLYHGRLFLTWGPVPALVVLVPLHLFDLEPSSGVVATFFAVVGFGFVLAVLRVLLRQLASPPQWMCALAALSLGLSSAVPFILRRPASYEEAITSGFCFAMAGIWLTVCALTSRQASLRRVALMSLCFGLAAGSRPTLVLTAVILIPVYMSLRTTLPRHKLLGALTLPIGGSLLLLMAYNQARFGNPFEVGVKYQGTGDPHLMYYANPVFVMPGLWFYVLSPPRPTILFPFIHLTPLPVSYPTNLPAQYLKIPAVTGGLAPMAPILVFLAVLPWIWRRQRALLGPFAVPLLLMAASGVAILLFVSYQFYSSTERYEVDFATLLLFGALMSWLALSCKIRGHRGRLVRVVGAALATWGCITGVAISFDGYSNLLASQHPHIWATLEGIGAPLSTAVADVLGHPVLAGVSPWDIAPESGLGYGTLGTGARSFSLGANERVTLTIVSPDSRRLDLVANVTPSRATESRFRLSADSPGGADYSQPIPRSGADVRIQVQVARGLNHFSFGPVTSAVESAQSVRGASQTRFSINHLSIADH